MTTVPEQSKHHSLSNGETAGFFSGWAASFVVIPVALNKANEVMVDRYIDKHSIVTTPSTRPAIEHGVYEQAVNKNVEVGIALSSLLGLIALGMAIGHKIEKMGERG